MAPGEAPSKSLWVGNLAPDMTDEDLVSLFQNFGPVNSITRCNSRGYGFVLFGNIHDSKEAKDALQGSFFHGNALRIEFAKPVCVFLIYVSLLFDLYVFLLFLHNYLLCFIREFVNVLLSNYLEKFLAFLRTLNIKKYNKIVQTRFEIK